MRYSNHIIFTDGTNPERVHVLVVFDILFGVIEE